MASKHLSAGRLRHRVRLDSRITALDSNGDTVSSWEVFANNVAAEIAPLSARETLRAQAMQSSVVGNMTLRYRTGLNAAMRVVHTNRGGTTYYNIAGVIPDNLSGEEWLTLPVSYGQSDG